MDGFWDSLYSYLGWDIYAYILFTILYIICLIPLRHLRKQRNYLTFSHIFLLSILLSFFGNYCNARVINNTGKNKDAILSYLSQMRTEADFHYYYPWGQVYYYAQIENCTDYNAWSFMYIKDYSIISYFPASFIFNLLRPVGKTIALSDDDILRLDPIFSHKKTNSITPKTNLIFILVESLESWPLYKIQDYEYMPYLSSLISNRNVLYCDKLTAQVKHGNSADGQMIDVTGVLPISDGATCRLYADNKFAGYAECYNNSAIINPTPRIWEQSKMTFGYQFKELIEPQNGERWNDSQLIEKILQYADSCNTPFCVLGITITSHAPFTYGSKFPKHILSGMPSLMSSYLNCLSYTDSCIHNLFDAIISNELLKDNTTIVISGDHTVFRSINKDIDCFAIENNIDMQTAKTYIPLIVYSPLIEGNIRVSEICYQMDVYPTITHLIGCEDYYWKGFGINLLDTADLNRFVSEQEAIELSDKLIRSNYFALIE